MIEDDPKVTGNLLIPRLTPQDARVPPRQERPMYCPDCGVEYTAPSWSCLYPHRHPAR